MRLEHRLVTHRQLSPDSIRKCFVFQRPKAKAFSMPRHAALVLPGHMMLSHTMPGRSHQKIIVKNMDSTNGSFLYCFRKPAYGQDIARAQELILGNNCNYMIYNSLPSMAPSLSALVQ